MTITVSNELDFNDLMNQCWSGAIDTLKRIREYDKEDEFMDLLSETFSDTIPNMTGVNDYLWFDADDIYDSLGISEDDEEGGTKSNGNGNT